MMIVEKVMLMKVVRRISVILGLKCFMALISNQNIKALISATFPRGYRLDIYNGVKRYTQNFGDDGNTTKDIFKNSFFGENGLTDMPRCGTFDEENQWVGDPSQNYSTDLHFGQKVVII